MTYSMTVERGQSLHSLEGDLSQGPIVIFEFLKDGRNARSSDRVDETEMGSTGTVDPKLIKR